MQQLHPQPPVLQRSDEQARAGGALAQPSGGGAVGGGERTRAPLPADLQRRVAPHMHDDVLRPDRAARADRRVGGHLQDRGDVGQGGGHGGHSRGLRRGVRGSGSRWVRGGRGDVRGALRQSASH